MDRRKFLVTGSTALGGLGLNAGNVATANARPVGGSEPVSPSHAKPRPNVLILMADQHRWNAMGVAGDKVAVTPNLDRFASESVRFTNAYCTNPVCAPSRASIMTGLYTHHLFSHSELLKKRGDSLPYSFKHKTMADNFHNAGYMTSIIGKMHFMDAQTHGFDYKMMFNDWGQYLGPKVHMYENELAFPNSGAGMPQIVSLWAKEGDPWNDRIVPDGRLGSVAVGRPSLMEEKDHFESYVARESSRFLEDYARQDQPFLLVSSFLKPHDPFMPARRFADMFHPEDMKLSPTWGKADLKTLPRRVVKSIETCPWTPELLQAPEARKRMAYYYGNLAQTDDCVGQVLDALKRTGLDKNTIVVYTSDHGEMLGDLGLWNKFQFYQGSCCVPLMVRLPGGSASLCDEPVSLISLKSSLSDLCGIPMQDPSDGKSFAGLVRDPGSHIGYGPVFAEYDLGNSGAKYMVRDKSLKYTFWEHDLPELYDLQNDPEEMHNLAVLPEYQDTVKRLKRELFAWHHPEKF